jgi:hypothetical protein
MDGSNELIRMAENIKKYEIMDGCWLNAVDGENLSRSKEPTTYDHKEGKKIQYSRMEIQKMRNRSPCM